MTCLEFVAMTRLSSDETSTSENVAYVAHATACPSCLRWLRESAAALPKPSAEEAARTQAATDRALARLRKSQARNK